MASSIQSPLSNKTSAEAPYNIESSQEEACVKAYCKLIYSPELNMTPEEHFTLIKQEFDKGNSYYKAHLCEGVQSILNASSSDILRASGRYEAEALNPSSKTEEFGGREQYITYNYMLFAACLMRWSKPAPIGLGLDGSYGGLRAPQNANMCVVS